MKHLENKRNIRGFEVSSAKRTGGIDIAEMFRSFMSIGRRRNG